MATTQPIDQFLSKSFFVGSKLFLPSGKFSGKPVRQRPSYQCPGTYPRTAGAAPLRLASSIPAAPAPSDCTAQKQRYVEYVCSQLGQTLNFPAICGPPGTMKAPSGKASC